MRGLTWATVSSSLAKGVFFSVSVLFFTRVMGLGAATVGIGLTVAGGVGVAASFAAGYLADRIGAHRVLVATTLGQAVALLAYVVADTTPAFVVTACAAVSQQAMQRTALTTLLARCFTGADRVDVRARLRVVTNIFIGVGTGIAGIALVLDTAAAYLAAMASTAVLLLASAVPLQRIRAAIPTAAGPRAAQRIAPGAARRSPLRDRTYLAATALSAVMTIHFGVMTVGVPLWVAGWTNAPTVTVAVLLALNTVMVALLQVRAARSARDVPSAGRCVAKAAALLVFACALYAAAAGGGVVVAICVLVLATVAHSAAEVLAEAGNWAMAFELADPDNAGAYQGVSQTGTALGSMLAPLVVTATLVDHGGSGWAAIAALFAGAGTGMLVLSRRYDLRRQEPVSL